MTSAMHDPVFLPQPTVIRPLDGRFALTNGTPVIIPPDLDRSEQQAIARFCESTRRWTGRRLVVRPGDPCASGPHIRLTSGAGALTGRPSGAYRVQIRPDRVSVDATDGAGLFHAIATLTQIAWSSGVSWPGMEIEDEPAFGVRGFHLDVSRGRVPTLESLKNLVRRLAHLKINQLQLYIEHTFAFAFNPRIAEGCSPLTADEIRELDAFCQLHRVELVPSIASCGHMARILSLPEYRHMAEIDADTGWDDLSWYHRVRGLTLDATHPESRPLLESMYAELVPLFSGGWVNVCCDETYDLGKGRGKPRADAIGVGRLYLDHLRWLRELCARYGKRMMYWGDIVRKHPDLLPELPRDARILHWDYGRHANYDSTLRFRQSGLDTVACPSTSAWARFVAGINVAEDNIRRHAETARQCGATGLLNTEWGDDGHVNMLTGSWHPMAVGAAAAWNPDALESEAFDRAFGFVMFGDRSGRLSRALRNLARLHDDVTDWRVLRAPFDDAAAHEPVSLDAAERLIDDARMLQEELHGLGLASGTPRPGSSESAGPSVSAARPSDDDEFPLGPADVEELRVASRLCERVGEKVLLARQLANASMAPDGALRDRLDRFADDLARGADEFARAWRARNKPAELHTVMRAFETVIRDARRLSGAS